jgi:hypothetical protein
MRRTFRGLRPAFAIRSHARREFKQIPAAGICRCSSRGRDTHRGRPYFRTVGSSKMNLSGLDEKRRSRKRRIGFEFRDSAFTEEPCIEELQTSADAENGVT